MLCMGTGKLLRVASDFSYFQTLKRPLLICEFGLTALYVGEIKM